MNQRQDDEGRTSAYDSRYASISVPSTTLNILHLTMSSISSSGSRRLNAAPINPLSPRPAPSRRRVTPQYTAEKAPHPIIRKPSFLEIADENPSPPYPTSRSSSMVRHSLARSTVTPVPQEEDSFLDMGKDSLDIPRDSLDEFGS